MATYSLQHPEKGLITYTDKKRYLWLMSVSYTHLRAHETLMNLVCRLLLEKILWGGGCVG